MIDNVIDSVVQSGCDPVVLNYFHLLLLNLVLLHLDNLFKHSLNIHGARLIIDSHLAI